MIYPQNKQAFVFIVFIVAIFVIGLTWVVLSKPLGISYNKYYNSSDTKAQVYQDFYIRSYTIWNFIPLIIVLSLILYVIIEIQRKRAELGDY